ncbi:hypothetical protein KCU99_g1897, partial [Aureobasidium melanogenum]
MVKRKASTLLLSSIVKREFDESAEPTAREINSNGSSLATLLTQRDRYPCASDLIFDYLGITGVIALTRVCKSLSTVYSDSVSRDWDINSRLGRFITEPADFRRVLGVNQGLIVGSTAFQFFAGVYWEGSSLDVLCESGAAVRAISAYLRKEGYRRQCTNKFWGGLPERFEYRIATYVKNGAPNTKINIISAGFMSIWGFLAGPVFSTASACFIAWDKAYCLFPKYTFGLRKLKFAHGLDTASDSVRAMLHRYEQNAYCLEDSLLEQGPDVLQDCKDTIKHLEGPRRIGDVKTWSVPLDCQGIPPIEVNSTVLEKHSFRVSVERDQGKLFFMIQTGEFQCCLLKHRYTFDALPHPQDDFHEYLRFVLCRRAAVQIEKHLDAGTFTLSRNEVRDVLRSMNAVAEQDVGMCDELCHLLFYRQNKGGFTKPENWQHVDHLIPEIYAEWLKYQFDHGVVKTEIKEENDDGEEIEEGTEED